MEEVPHRLNWLQQRLKPRFKNKDSAVNFIEDLYDKVDVSEFVVLTNSDGVTGVVGKHNFQKMIFKIESYIY